MKILNPIIWLWNVFKYFAHYQIKVDTGVNPGPYDFSKDTKYF